MRKWQNSKQGQGQLAEKPASKRHPTAELDALVVYMLWQQYGDGVPFDMWYQRRLTEAIAREREGRAWE